MLPEIIESVSNLLNSPLKRKKERKCVQAGNKTKLLVEKNYEISIDSKGSLNESVVEIIGSYDDGSPGTKPFGCVCGICGRVVPEDNTCVCIKCYQIRCRQCCDLKKDGTSFSPPRISPT